MCASTGYDCMCQINLKTGPHHVFCWLFLNLKCYLMSSSNHWSHICLFSCSFQGIRVPIPLAHTDHRTNIDLTLSFFLLLLWTIPTSILWATLHHKFPYPRHSYNLLREQSSLEQWFITIIINATTTAHGATVNSNLAFSSTLTPTPSVAEWGPPTVNTEATIPTQEAPQDDLRHSITTSSGNFFGVFFLVFFLILS